MAISLIALIIACGGNGGGDSVPHDIIDDTNQTIPSSNPVLESVMVYDDYFVHVPPRIWRVGETWKFIIHFYDDDNDADHIIVFLQYDTGYIYDGPHIVDLDGAQTSYSSTASGLIVPDDTGIYILSVIVVDSAGNESDELFDDVRIKEGEGNETKI